MVRCLRPFTMFVSTRMASDKSCAPLAGCSPSLPSRRSHCSNHQFPDTKNSTRGGSAAVETLHRDIPISYISRALPSTFQSLLSGMFQKPAEFQLLVAAAVRRSCNNKTDANCTRLAGRRRSRYCSYVGAPHSRPRHCCRRQ